MRFFEPELLALQLFMHFIQPAEAFHHFIDALLRPSRQQHCGDIDGFLFHGYLFGT